MDHLLKSVLHGEAYDYLPRAFQPSGVSAF